ncbi:MAG: glycosyltransferase, partial [Alphaproteobacteria bacterium]|nr:glycosyltransferase [Alphaproteobacteria bacterium]
KTPAIARLIAEAPGYRHVVYSLNRFDGLAGIESLPFGQDRIAVAYGAPSRGVLLAMRLRHLARWIEGDLKVRGIVPDLVHAHKLTIEGLIALELHERNSWPIVTNIQGNTDIKVARWRPDLTFQFRRVAAISQRVFPFAPWNVPALAHILGAAAERCVVLPVVPHIDTFVESSTSAPRIASVFHLDSWHRKGADTLARAAVRAKQNIPDLEVHIFGGGGAIAVRSIAQLLKTAGASQTVRLMGPVQSDEIQEKLASYAGFAMPSRVESFGLVYVEALFSGIPVLWSRGRGIDGYLPSDAIGYACDSASDADVAAGMLHILRHQTALKSKIAAMQRGGQLDLFRRATIGATYRGVLHSVLS